MQFIQKKAKRVLVNQKNSINKKKKEFSLTKECVKQDAIKENIKKEKKVVKDNTLEINNEN